MKGVKKPIIISLPFGLIIRVTGKFEYDPAEVAIMVGTYLPGGKASQKQEPTLTVEYIESAERKLVRGKDRIVIYDDWQGKISLDLWHFLYSIERIHLLKNGHYCVHAACAGLTDYALLLGHSGDGKSTVLLKLINDFQWRVVSGNKTIVSFGKELTAEGGTKSMSVKERWLTRFDSLTVRTLEYGKRSAFILDAKHYSDEEKVPIKTVYLIKLNDGVSEKEIETLPSSMHSLYPFFMDEVNADTIMCGGNDVLVGTPPDGSQQNLAKLLTETLQGIQVVKLAGSLDFIVKTITE